MKVSPVHVQEVTKTGPIVWKGTTHVAATGYNFSTHVAVLMSPCGPLQELSASSNDSEVITNYLACRLKFEEVLSLIKESCSPIEEIDALGFNDKLHGKRHRRSDFPLSFNQPGGELLYQSQVQLVD